MRSVGERVCAVVFVVCILLLMLNPSMSGTGFHRDAARAYHKLERSAGSVLAEAKNEVGALAEKIGSSVAALD